jgi:hypothetical protein
MPTIPTTTIKARVTKRVKRPPKPNEITPERLSPYSMSTTALLEPEDRRLSHQQPSYAQVAKDTTIWLKSNRRNSEQATIIKIKLTDSSHRCGGAGQVCCDGRGDQQDRKQPRLS